MRDEDNDRPDAEAAEAIGGASARCEVIGGIDERGGLTASVAVILAQASACRLAVGYLFVEGLSPFLDALGRLERIDLLIGNVVNRLTDEQMREMGGFPDPAGDGQTARAGGDSEFAALYRTERNQAAQATALNLRRTIESLTHSQVNRETILALAHWIAEGRLRVRLSTRSRLHAKVTLVSYPSGHEHSPGRAIVGTSNLTLGEVLQQEGSRANQSDLDVLLDGAANYRRLTAWFDHHWNDAQDFRRELFQELGRAWPLRQP